MKRVKTGYLGNPKPNLHVGFKIEPDGRVLSEFFHRPDFVRCFTPVPVQWNGASAKLYYWHYHHKRTPLNRTACELILHPDFPIQGTAIVVTKVERWHQFRVKGDIDDAREKIAHLGLAENKLRSFQGGGPSPDPPVHLR